MALVLSGREVRDSRRSALADRVNAYSRKPQLVVIQVGDRPDSVAYVTQKQRFGESVGARVSLWKYDTDIPQAELEGAVREASTREDVDGVIVQLPLPDGFSEYQVIEAIDPKKDVDGLTAVNSKKVRIGRDDALVPATARGIMTLLASYGVPIAGRRACVVGRSMLVGQPTAAMLLRADATLVHAHSKTHDLASVTRLADIVIVAAGSPGLIGVDHVSSGQCVIDVGITLSESGHYVGDVVFDEVEPIVEYLSSVPGGVGPMTVLSLFENLADAHEQAQTLAI